jgi:hypothetical protein
VSGKVGSAATSPRQHWSVVSGDCASATANMPNRQPRMHNQPLNWDTSVKPQAIAVHQYQPPTLVTQHAGAISISCSMHTTIRHSDAMGDVPDAAASLQYRTTTLTCGPHTPSSSSTISWCPSSSRCCSSLAAASSSAASPLLSNPCLGAGQALACASPGSAWVLATDRPSNAMAQLGQAQVVYPLSITGCTIQL